MSSTMLAHHQMNKSCWILFILLSLATRILGANIIYCSSENTGSAVSPVYNQFQSNGACHDTCTGKYSIAIIAGSQCWCSNYAPATTVSVTNCQVQCPGYMEWCGNAAQGYYAYFLLDGKVASGTVGASSSTPSSSTTSPTTTTVSSSTSAATSQDTAAPTTDSRASTSDSTSSPAPTQVLTSVTTVTGQARTILITPSSTPDSSLGSTGSSGGGGVGTGAVVGIVIGVALIVAIVFGFGVWYVLRRRQRRAADDASIGPTSVNGGNNGVPSRQVSQMSSAGLLSRGPRINTTGIAPSSGPKSAGSNRHSLGTDQRLNPYAIYAQEESRHSNVSLQDNQDYSRQLRVANPDP